MVAIARRDNVECFTDDFGDVQCYRNSFWFTTAGYIVKWVIFALIFLVFWGWVGGYIHAKRRLRKGLPLLKYHRWMIPRAQRQPAPQGHFTFYQQSTHPEGQQYGATGGYYGMQSYNQEPLPLYNNDAPPQYQPPPGASKAHPAQTTASPQYGAVPATARQGPAPVGESAALPPRPEPAKTTSGNAFRWLRK